jgi:type IV pilus assembly protein PilE
MIFKKKMAFTLNESVIVVVLLGILAAIAIPSYFLTVQKSRAKEAKSALGLIQAGQKIYYSRTKTYLNDGNIANINSQLGLSLEESYWNYSANNGPPNNIGTAVRGACTYTVSTIGAITGTASCPE